MLPSKSRLKTSFFRSESKKYKKRVWGKNIVLSFEKGSGQLKAGVVVSKKIAALATRRNRIKRMIYESLRGYQDKLNGDLVIIVKEDLADLKKAEVEKILQPLLKKLI
ncbi:ribonuclease P protein component [Candidatus Curtissbacteria bacterium RIFCSPHIGHO2_12_FULL_38_9b]|uniref:Ribonuclease P protein component n=2 Tax=Candidatus Curtissiibacteriota TaxID=1752717 RepID=A0A1F5GX35_9BACT|nr:MAG: ribonuclease P protein component [Candidatus Curtissbacteria bacterium RIFCSPLOWO2_01_FULL_37_9]OGD96472.1 MAG: ribonuclease P protein component [Candidatus Curtissbacteria bacterium RIFCSPHIGHO2_12_FULL_38_9b]